MTTPRQPKTLTIDRTEPVTAICNRLKEITAELQASIDQTNRVLQDAKAYEMRLHNIKRTTPTR